MPSSTISDPAQISEAYLDANGKPDLLEKVREVVRLAEVFEVRQDEALDSATPYSKQNPQLETKTSLCCWETTSSTLPEPAIAQLMADRGEDKRLSP